MRVFILCTGRSGSVSIIKACKHIKNYTSGHESLAKAFGDKRFDYPENHIEADNRLSWHLGQLHRLYGDEPFYIHLKRDREKVAKSFMKRFYMQGSIMDAFCDGIKMTPSEKLSEELRLQACYDYVDTVNANIEYFMADKSKVMTIHLETVEAQFSELWQQINATGNLEDAIKSFDKPHNASAKRKFNYKNRLQLMAIREWRHIKMCIKS